MAQLYLIPQWFFGVDIALEIIFGLITLSVALYSLHIYRLSYQRECKLLALGFASISLAYFVWSFINLFIVSNLADGTRALTLGSLSFLGSLGVYGHILLLTLGFATLAYMTLDVRGYRSYALFVTLPLLVIIFSAYKALAFYFILSFLVFYLVIHYVLEYSRKRRQTTLLLLVAFILILIGNVSFTFAAIRQVHYVIGHALELAGYLLVLASFIITLSKTRK